MDVSVESKSLPSVAILENPTFKPPPKSSQEVN